MVEATDTSKPNGNEHLFRYNEGGLIQVSWRTEPGLIKRTYWDTPHNGNQEKRCYSVEFTGGTARVWEDEAQPYDWRSLNPKYIYFVKGGFSGDITPQERFVLHIYQCQQNASDPIEISGLGYFILDYLDNVDIRNKKYGK